MGVRDRAEELRRSNLAAVATDLFVRDRDAFASVLGSALAMRLFLFVVPANVALIALVNAIDLGSVFEQTATSSVTVGDLADNYGDVGFWAGMWAFVSALALSLWAGRTVVRVLAMGSTAAWRLPPSQAKLGIKPLLSLSSLLIAILAVNGLLERVRDIGGLGVSLGTWVIVPVVMTATWFMVLLTLPRPSSDPGAVLPGVILVGIGFTVLQWFMQFYLPRRVEDMSDRFGSLATTLASLSYFFLVGRLMAASLVVSAVAYERWGSVSSRLFALPLVRRVPARWPGVARYFSLPTAESPPSNVSPDL